MGGALFPANQQQKTDESTNSNKATSSRLPFGKYFFIKTSFFILTLLCMLFAHGMTQVFVLSGILASFSTLGLPGLLMVLISKLHKDLFLILKGIYFGIAFKIS